MESDANSGSPPNRKKHGTCDYNRGTQRKGSYLKKMRRRDKLEDKPNRPFEKKECGSGNKRYNRFA